MDDNVFLQTGRIVPDVGKMEEYRARHGDVTFSSMASKSIAFYSDWKGYQVHLLAIYATLLKIGLLSLSKYSVVDKFTKLCDFFQNELGVFLVREAVVACLHFSNRHRQFIPVQRGSMRVRRRLLASSWDLLLLHLPETLISQEGADYTSLYFVCTADKMVSRVGEIVQVVRVGSVEPLIGHRAGTLLGLREDLLNEEIGEELTARLFAIYRRQRQVSRERRSRDLAGMQDIVADLEKQVVDVGSSL